VLDFQEGFPLYFHASAIVALVRKGRPRGEGYARAVVESVSFNSLVGDEFCGGLMEVECCPYGYQHEQ
jgi:hypothetical protein